MNILVDHDLPASTRPSGVVRAVSRRLLPSHADCGLTSNRPAFGSRPGDSRAAVAADRMPSRISPYGEQCEFPFATSQVQGQVLPAEANARLTSIFLRYRAR